MCRGLFYIVLCTCLTFGKLAHTATDQNSAQERGASRVEKSNVELSADKFAIVVGIDQYSQYSGLSSLNYAVADAVALADVLEADGYRVLRRFNADANRQFILDSISTVAQLAESSDKSDSTLLFSFAGHGFASKGENYLVTQGASRDQLVETGLSISDVQKALRDTGIARRMMFIDACRNDPNPSARSASAESFVTHNRGEGEVTLYSTRVGEFSYESPDLGHGVFSHFLVKGLSGEAANDGTVTLQGIKSYVEKEVRFWTGANIGKVQTPYTVTNYTGTFPLISKVVKAEPTIASTAGSVGTQATSTIQTGGASNNTEAPSAINIRPDSVLLKPGKGTEFLLRSLEDLFQNHELQAGIDGLDNEDTALRLHTTERGIFLEEQFGNLVIRGEVSVKLTNANGKTIKRQTFQIDGAAPVHVYEAEARAAQGFVNQFESSSIMRALEEELFN